MSTPLGKDGIEAHNTKMSENNSFVTHNPQASRYELGIDGRLAILEYTERDGIYDLSHTFVPEELRGRLHASDLVSGALDDIRKKGAKIYPSCPYVAAFLRRHPEYADMNAAPRA